MEMSSKTTTDADTLCRRCLLPMVDHAHIAITTSDEVQHFRVCPRTHPRVGASPIKEDPDGADECYVIDPDPEGEQ